MKKIYLAIPYTGMYESSYEQANKASIKILKMGHNVFSPITHSHPLSKNYPGAEIPTNWDFWKKIDYQFIDWADEVWVCVPKEGEKAVLNSPGVQAEIQYARKHNKLIYAIINSNPDIFSDKFEFIPQERIIHKYI